MAVLIPQKNIKYKKKLKRYKKYKKNDELLTLTFSFVSKLK